MWHITSALMGVSDNRTVHEWSMRSATKVEIVMWGKTEKVGYIFGKFEQCVEFTQKYDK